MTTVSNEVRKVVDAFDLSPSELHRLLLHGFKRSFFPGSYKEKRAYVRKVIDYYNRVATEHGVPLVSRGSLI
jgi:adenosine deaminase